MREPEHETEFQDPALRSAVRQAMGGERAPADLRRRVGAMFAAAAVGHTVAAGASAAAGGSRWSLAWPAVEGKTVAAAAVALLAVGFAAVQVKIHLFPDQPTSVTYARPIAFPVSVSSAAISTHNNCAKLHDHHLVKGDDPAALREQLTKLEGVAVAAMNLGPEWTFKGAGLCQLGDAKAAHLLYARGDEVVSVFSLPSPGSCRANSYSEVADGHAIRGFTHQGALYCVVGSRAGGKPPEAGAMESVVLQVQHCLGIEGCGY